MPTQIGSVALLACLAVLGVAGGYQLRQRRRLLGAILLIEALAGIGAFVALVTVPVGIGSPLIRIPVRMLPWIGVFAFGAAGVMGGIAVVWAQGRRRIWPYAPAVVALLAPCVAAASLWGLTVASTPVRERERDPGKRVIEAPPGFRVSIYAQGGIDNPTSIAFGPTGELYIADISGALWLARDANHDGRVDRITKYADGFDLLVGLLWHNGELFTSSAGRIEALRDTDGDGVADARRVVTDGLPALILQPHSNNALTLGPDGRIYFGIGSSVTRGVEPRQLAGTIVSVSPDGGEARVMARGFGNVFKVAFNRRGDLFAGDNSSNSPDIEDDPPDELNFVTPNADYGHGSVKGTPDERAGTRDPLVAFEAHAVPTGLTFYEGASFPAEYRDAAFLALWNRGEVVWLRFEGDAAAGYRARPALFADGFLYPIDIVAGPDDSLYVADFGTSVIYRISYEGVK